MRTYNIYKDLMNGLHAAATNSTMAWQLIRNECHRRNWKVPTLDAIILIKKCTLAETQELKQIKKTA